MNKLKTDYPCDLKLCFKKTECHFKCYPYQSHLINNIEIMSRSYLDGVINKYYFKFQFNLNFMIFQYNSLFSYEIAYFKNSKTIDCYIHI